MTLKSLLSPVKPADKKFDEIVAVLTKHYSLLPSEVVQSYHFFLRVRQLGESVSAFIAALRRLARDCNFGDALMRIRRDKIVFSINDDVIQKKLLDEHTLTYKRAIELAESAKAAARGQREMKTPLQTVKVEPQTVNAPITVHMTLDGKPVTLEVDTGAARTIMSEEAYHKLWPTRSLDRNVQLQSYLGEQ